MTKVTFAGELGSLDAISEFVLQHAGLAGLDKHAAYQLRLAVDELATNIIVHGYQDNGLRGDIVASITLDERSLAIMLEDTALPYDPRRCDLGQVVENFDKPLDERPVGGLGIFFVTQAVDEFRYEWKEGRNRNILVIHRPLAPVTSTVGCEGVRNK